MRISTKITVLAVTGVFVSCLIIFLFIYTQMVLGIYETHSLNDIFIERQVEREFEKAVRAGDFTDFGKRLQENAEALVFDASRTVLASNFAGVPAGSRIGDQLLNRLLSSPRGLYAVYRMREKGGEERFVFLGFRNSENHPPSLIGMIARAMGGSLLLFSGTVIGTVMLLIRMRKHLTTLSEAASRIAHGDLNFKLTLSSGDEIGSLARDFERMRAALREETDRRSRFLMAASHDLKTPLTSIKGYIEAMSDGLAEDAKVRHEYLNILSEKSRLLEDRLSELLDFGMMETGEWRLRLEKTDLGEFLRDVCEEFRMDAVLKRRSFDYRLELRERFIVPADPLLFSRVLENLVGNAMRYTRDGDRIAVSARLSEETGTAVVMVEDTGPGIDPRELSHIFDPLFRGTRTRNEPGFGLGLSIVKSIVEAHGWGISVRSESGKGTCFTLTLRQSFWRPDDGGVGATVDNGRPPGAGA
jgi:signal transduction histidine kinase